MKHSSTEHKRQKSLNGVLSTLSESFVVVEGRHDVAALRSLGIASHTYEQTMRSRARLPEIVHILTDGDRRGMEKAERLTSYLIERGVRPDLRTGTRLLKMVGAKHIEEIVQPVQQRLQTEDENNKTKGDRYGENLFGYSKIHGRGKVLDQRHGRQA